MTIRLMIAFGVLWFMNVYSNQHENWKSDDSTVKNDLIICVTIPKAGTHLLLKCLTLLHLDRVFYSYNRPSPFREGVEQESLNYQSVAEYFQNNHRRLRHRIDSSTNGKRSFIGHIPYDSSYKDFFDQYTTSNFLMIRDPRSQLIALTRVWIEDLNSANSSDIEEILLKLLNGEQIHTACRFRSVRDCICRHGIVKFYRSFLKWSEHPKFCVVRYENLVGPLGGGMIDLQLEEIRKIVNHLGCNLPGETILNVANQLYGETKTFRQGQSQSWKQYFTPAVKNAFKNTAGACQLLIELGYEEDCNW